MQVRGLTRGAFSICQFFIHFIHGEDIQVQDLKNKKIAEHVGPQLQNMQDPSSCIWNVVHQCTNVRHLAIQMCANNSLIRNFTKLLFEEIECLYYEAYFVTLKSECKVNTIYQGRQTNYWLNLLVWKFLFIKYWFIRFPCLHFSRALEKSCSLTQNKQIIILFKAAKLSNTSPLKLFTCRTYYLLYLP